MAFVHIGVVTTRAELLGGLVPWLILMHGVAIHAGNVTVIVHCRQVVGIRHKPIAVSEH